MLVFRHPKYYAEMRRRATKFQKEQADKQASEQARRGAGGPTSHEQGSEQASDQASDEEASKQRWMWSQSLIAREGVSRWSVRRPGTVLLSYSFTSLREGWLTRIKLRFVLVKWNNFWCGLNDILLPLTTLSSTIKNPQESLYPNRSGTPKDAQDSSLVHWIWGVFFLINCQNLDSGFTGHTYFFLHIRVPKSIHFRT